MRIVVPLYTALPNHVKYIVNYGVLLFLISLGDAIMSYYSPVYIERSLSSGFLMGLIISTSSIAGVVTDFLLARSPRSQNFRVFFVFSIAIGLLFPLSLMFLPPVIPALILSMMVWGIYYELVQFSNFLFIKTYITKDRYPTAWGVLSSLKSAGYLAGPFIAAYLIGRGAQTPFSGALIFYIAGFIGLTLFFPIKLHRIEMQHTEATEPLYTFRQTLTIWKTLLKRIFPMYLFSFALVLVDATFWTVGTVFSEVLQESDAIGLFFLPAYMLPSLGFSILAGPAAKPFGKKRIAFICGIFTGIGLIFTGIAQSTPLILLCVLAASACTAIAHPEVASAFEDYVLRLRKTGTNLIGLESTSVGLAYIVGPVLAGGLSVLVGNQLTFAVIGGILTVISIILLITTPRKLKMPQTELAAEVAHP